ncbi:butyrate response factor [Nematocida sp. LUAm3]|nr:butyrate response factor [Nematocida sp. LUAm3]KAI5174952.1 butyrate response factor [Nematocida sp. LUAm2]KAI5177449.1 butyrate response factor [Nematocida sp. LUAm1]
MEQEESKIFSVREDNIPPQDQQELQRKEKKRAKKSLSKKKISLYKTEICKSFESSNYCSYGDRCQFAHSFNELRDVERHPRYKTELCKTYTTQGNCSYGKRCCFIHAGPEDAKDADLQDARNLPGDWKAPGIDFLDDDIEMSMISVDSSEIKGQETLTPEETEKLLLLSKYKQKAPIFSGKPRKTSLFANSSGTFLGTKNSSSSFWAMPHQCFIFVDSLCTVSGLRALGKAPGSFFLLKTQKFEI